MTGARKAPRQGRKGRARAQRARRAFETLRPAFLSTPPLRQSARGICCPPPLAAMILTGTRFCRCLSFCSSFFPSSFLFLSLPRRLALPRPQPHLPISSSTSTASVVLVSIELSYLPIPFLVSLARVAAVICLAPCPVVIRDAFDR